MIKIHFDDIIYPTILSVYYTWSKSNTVAGDFDSKDNGTDIIVRSYVKITAETTLSKYKINWRSIKPCKKRWSYYEGICYYYNTNLMTNLQAYNSCLYEDQNACKL